MQLEEYVAPEDIFTRVRLLLLVLGLAGSSTRATTSRCAIERFGLDADSLVVELASNDGYLLQHFVERGIPVLGIEPAANVAEVAQERGIVTVVAFFGAASWPTARGRGPARRPDRRATTSWPTSRTSTTSSAASSAACARRRGRRSSSRICCG